MAHDTHDTSAADVVVGSTTSVGSLRTLAMLALVAGGITFAVGAGVQAGSNKDQWLRDALMAYQVGFVFWVSIPIGALALSYLAYLTTASWGLVLRRVFQAYFRTWPLLCVLFLPIALGLFINDGKHSPFWWTQDPASMYPDNKPAVTEAQHKIDDFLNKKFFLARAVGYLVFYGLCMSFVARTAKKAEDLGDAKSKAKLRVFAGPGLVLWCLITTIMVTDWVMSVEPPWASTMFPVVFAMNAFLTAIASATFVFYTLNMKNPQVFQVYVKDKFRIDIGSLTFGFTMIWSYASFCQFMLIWAGNLPEEIPYYLKRINGGWQYLTYLLAAVHWFIPFVLFLFREIKQNPKSMRRMTMLLVFICMVDVVWWLVPALSHVHTDAQGVEHTGKAHVVMAFGALLGIGGIFGIVFTGHLKQRGLLPETDAQFLKNWGHH